MSSLAFLVTELQVGFVFYVFLTYGRYVIHILITNIMLIYSLWRVRPEESTLKCARCAVRLCRCRRQELCV